MSMFLCVACDHPRSRGRTSQTCREVRRPSAHWLWSLLYIITSRRRCMLWTRLTQHLTSRTSQSSPTTSRYDYCKTLFSRRILISRFTCVENSLNFNFADFPVTFIEQFFPVSFGASNKCYYRNSSRIIVYII